MATCTTTVSAFVSVLEAEAWDIYDADALNGAIIATLANASGRWIRTPLHDIGEGGFTINRHAAEATEDILAEGNMVKVRIADCGPDYIDGFFLGPDGDYTLLSPRGEKGKELLTFRGPGPLSYLDRARMTQCAFSIAGTTVGTWTRLWTTKNVSQPGGAAVDPDDLDHVYIIGVASRKIRKVDQATREVVSSSPALWAGTGKYAGGLSFDPDDDGIVWVLEVPWLSGSSANTKIRKVDRADWSILDTFDLGSAVKLTDIRVDGDFIYTSRYDNDVIQQRSKSTGNVVDSSTITYRGKVQRRPNGIAINGTTIAYWFGGDSGGGTGRALLADTSDPWDITGVQVTTGISAFGGEWYTEDGEDFLIAVSYTEGKTWKYQLSSSVPACADESGVFHPEQVAPGALAWRVLVEITHPDRPSQPCPELSYDFTEDEDSNGTPWPARTSTEEFTWRVGDRAYSDVLARLIPAGVTFDLDVNTMTLHAYVDADFGTDRTSGTFAADKVRFEEGVNLAVNGDLGRRDNRGQPETDLTVAGDGGVYGAATLAGRYVREGFLQVAGPTTEAVLDAIGDDELARQRLVSDALGFETLWADDDENGRYIPKKHYWKGDLVTVDMVPAEFSYTEAELRVYGTLITERDGGWRSALDLGSAYKVPPPTTQVPGEGGSNGQSSGGGSSGGTTVVTSIPLTVSDGEDVNIPRVTRIIAEGVTSPEPGVALIPANPSAGGELLGLDDVDADDIADGQGIAWDEDLEVFVPVDFAAGDELELGAVTVGGSPVTVSSGSDHRAFPGVAWLDNPTAAAHDVGDRFLIVYRRGSDHVTGGKIVGKIGTITVGAPTWAYTLGAEFDILDTAVDLRVEDSIAILDIDGTGDYRAVIAFREFTGGLGGANTNPGVLVSDVAPSAITNLTTWSRYNIALSGHTQDWVVGRVHKLANGRFMVAFGFISGATHTNGVCWTNDITDWTAPTFVNINSSAAARDEINLEEMPDGTIHAHLRNDPSGGCERSTSTDHGDTWSAPTFLFASQGWPSWRRLPSGIGVTVTATDPAYLTAFRQTATGDTDSGWGSETVLDSTANYTSSYATFLQLDDNEFLVVYGIENSGLAFPPTDSDLYSVIGTDSSVFPSSGTVRVSQADTTPGFLEEKMVAGSGITLTKLGTGGDESIQIVATGVGATPVTAADILALGFMGPILMADGITSPPEPLYTEDGTDYLYADL